MRSTWSAERALALLAAASLEGAWITLLYVAFQWPTPNHLLHLGIGHLAAGVLVGAVLARRIRRWPQRQYAAAIIGAAIIAAGVGAWLAIAPDLRPGEIVTGVLVNPGGWLLGLALLRGTAHADSAAEAEVARRVLDRGMLGLVAFWVVATASDLVHAQTFAAAAFAATLTFISAGLLSLGLGRLTDLDVEASDPARPRWIALLLGVSGLVLLVGIPLAAVLGLPLESALAGIVGPLAPLAAAFFTLLAVPVGLLFEALVALLRSLPHGHPLPTVAPALASAAGHQVVPSGSAPNLTWLIWVGAVAGVALALAVIAWFVRRPEIVMAAEPAEEVREAEPIDVGLGLRLPRLRLGRRWRRSPRDAIEAYRYALDSLVGREEARLTGETPREHAARVRPMEIGPRLGRLAADYQLSALAGRTLNDPEQRRALDRWRQITRGSRR
ncbi:MAG: hypothetical protein ACXWL8_02935 [Candidatus Limnocylindria bacterium]